MNLRSGDSVSALAKVVAARGAAEDVGGEEELTLEAIGGEHSVEAAVDSGEVVRG
jgi:hypothetical protein